MVLFSSVLYGKTVRRRAYMPVEGEGDSSSSSVWWSNFIKLKTLDHWGGQRAGSAECLIDQKTLDADKTGANEISLCWDVSPEGFTGRSVDSLLRKAVPISHSTEGGCSLPSHASDFRHLLHFIPSNIYQYIHEAQLLQRKSAAVNSYSSCLRSSNEICFCQHLSDASLPFRVIQGHRWWLWSTGALRLIVPRTRTKTAKRAFSVAAPNVWNSLPIDIRNTNSLLTFRNKLKTHFFTAAYKWWDIYPPQSLCILSL